MDHLTDGQETNKFATNRAWWTPTLLWLLLLPKQIHSSQLRWWLVDVAVLLLLLPVLYVLTHPTLTFSPHSLAQRRGPFHVSINLSDLQSVRVITTARRTAVNDPRTGERRSVIRFYAKYPDDSAGKPPVQGLYVRDADGHHLTLRFLRSGADRWGECLLHAIREQPEVELGPRVMEALASISR